MNFRRFSFWALLLFMIIAGKSALADPFQNDNLINCLIDCRSASNCDACSTLRDCGPYYKGMNPVYNDSGDAWWHRCQNRDTRGGRRSERLRAACMDYCAANWRDCDICSTLSYCGEGYNRLRSFTDSLARNWYACTDGKPNWADMAWYNANPAGAITGSLDGIIAGQDKIEFGTVCTPFILPW